MKSKEHIEKFDESMEESLGESPKPFAVDDVVSVMVITVAVVAVLIALLQTMIVQLHLMIVVAIMEQQQLFNQIQETADNLEDKARFLSYPIPKAIVEEWEKNN